MEELKVGCTFDDEGMTYTVDEICESNGIYALVRAHAADCRKVHIIFRKDCDFWTIVDSDVMSPLQSLVTEFDNLVDCA